MNVLKQKQNQEILNNYSENMQNHILEKIYLKMELAGKRDIGDIREFLNYS